MLLPPCPLRPPAPAFAPRDLLPRALCAWLYPPGVKTAVRGAIWYQGESNVACSDVWGYSQGGNCAMNAANCANYYSCQFPVRRPPSRPTALPAPAPPAPPPPPPPPPPAPPPPSRPATALSLFVLAIVTHGPCWGLHTERETLRRFSHWSLCSHSLSLSRSPSQLLRQTHTTWRSSR